MFFGFAIIFLSGILLGGICKRLRLPPLIGMLTAGIFLGPYGFNLIDRSVISMSAELRKIALIIILARAGFSLDVQKLRENGLPAVLMCFVPACFEIAGMVIFAPMLLGITRLEAAILGAVVGAVSPAVIVPKMLSISDEGYGNRRGIPQLIMAGASVDDVFVIVMFSSFTALEKTGSMSFANLFKIPVSIVTGIAVGAVLGLMLCSLFKKIKTRDSIKLTVFMSFWFLFVVFEDRFSDAVPFSALIAVMCTGIAVQKVNPPLGARLAARFGKIWTAAEVMLFVLVGASVDIGYAAKSGAESVVLIFAVLLFRMAGVFLCLAGTKMCAKEKLFCMLSYLPKATVQAAIGGIPLAMGFKCGETVLTVAVISIIITAPTGAFLIDATYKKLLSNN